MTYIVGVTGGIGSGKTTVTDRFASHGIEVIDADVIAREVVAPGSDALKQIAEYFGPEVILPDGALNRAQLRSLVFADSDKKEWLNQLLHPLIRHRIEDALQAARSDYCILVAPLLLENQLQALVDRVLVVDVAEETQIERTTRRDNNSREQVAAIIDAQITREERLAAADDCINNELPLPEVYDQVDALHQQYLKLAKR
ncbi:dephospho-CoA kinase [Aliidiomarina minuta]|uniref:Dephospho-CoA kinase n=1 Tax=Aliidiomarina minuta TaxID=880057 RepID=A0A432WAF2_9GAMM|nr:dephospho-CoA kinase [Aliidiomarina minuta]RUO27137.1 dephospho-CoA kinase [Aliidiomarina minuta]